MSTDPRVSNRVLVCRDCQQPLEIVCPTHGRTVSRTVDVAPSDREPKSPRVPRRPRKLNALRLRDRIQGFVSLYNATAPCTPSLIADRFGITAAHASVELVYLVKHGLVARVGKGLYAAVQS